MVIDCDTCVVRGLACGDCVMSVLLGYPETPATAKRQVDAPEPVRMLEIDEEQHRAFDVLAEAGLVPHLRLVHPPETEAQRDGGRRAG